MQNQDPTSLDNFVDIVPAEPVTFWPPAIGWWFVIALVAIWAIVLLVLRIKKWFKDRYRREAIKELELVEPKPENATLETLVQIDSVLKRAALVAYPREKVASLTGLEWMKFLETTSNDSSFQNEPVIRLATAASDVESKELSSQQLQSILITCKKWIHNHSPEVPEC